MRASTFNVGRHFPVYLWAGSGTVRMNRLKFMGSAVDENVHAEAHTRTGALRMSREAGFNWAYLMYNWGFPPEIEKADWEEFRKAASVYQEAGLRVFGYVQMSNCVFEGSFREIDWYAQTPDGRKIYYYTGRYMTCWRHPQWLDHLKNIIAGILEAGADGVFFDNPWHGAQPLHLAGAWLGWAGCYCTRCLGAFRQETGFQAPSSLAPETDPDSQAYLEWRTREVTRTLAMLSDYARSIRPDVFISANNFDAIMRPSTVYGIDLRSLSNVQDVMMIEDFGLPRWETSPTGERSLLVNNALTLRTARALVGDTPLTSDPYDRGIGFDQVYPPRRLAQGIAEAAACGTAMVVKGTEFIEDGKFTLLTAPRYTAQRAVVKRIQDWLAAHSDLYTNRRNAAKIGLFYPEREIWRHWDRIAAVYFGAAQTLTSAGLPWRVVTKSDDLSQLDVLLTFSESTAEMLQSGDMRRISVQALDGWQPKALSTLARWRGLKPLTSSMLVWLHRAYFRWQWARSLGDRLGVVQFVLQSSHFQLPPIAMQKTLLEAIEQANTPQVHSDVPTLVEYWQYNTGQEQLHLVNYAAGPQQVNISLGKPRRGVIVSPDRNEESFQGNSVQLEVDVYSVLLFEYDV